MAKVSRTKDKKTLEANLSRSGQHISIQWIVRDESVETWEDYLVVSRTVLACGAKQRERLADLESCDWSADGEAERLDCLRQLAKGGIELYELLLTGADGVESSQLAAKRFREWFEKTVRTDPDNWRIQVVHQQYDTLVLPWGLVFTPLADGGDTDTLTHDFDDYFNFWAHSFGLAVRGTHGLEAEKTEAVPKASDSRVTITIEVGDEVIEFAKKNKPSLSDEYFESRVAEDMDQLIEVSQNYDEMNIFWYIQLQAEDGRFILDGEPFEASEFSDVAERRQHILLLMLDGDSVLTSDGGISWLRQMLIHGRSGLLAAETDITNPDLKLFGWTFLKTIMEEQNQWLADAIADARKEFWPQSILFGVYCDPLNIQFNPPLENEIQHADAFLESVRTFLSNRNSVVNG